MRWRIVDGLRKEEERRVRVSLGRRVVEMEAEVVKVWVCGGWGDESLSFVEDEEEIEIAMVELSEKRREEDLFCYPLFWSEEEFVLLLCG